MACSIWLHATDGHLSRTAIARRLEQPTRALAGPGGPARRNQTASDKSLAAEPARMLCLALLRMGFAEPASRPAAGALLPHRFTLTAAVLTGARTPAEAKPFGHRLTEKARRGGLLSVALSRALRPVDVIDHPALWSPDFPPAATAFRRQQPTTVRPAIKTFSAYQLSFHFDRDGERG